ncbi:MAG: hypothetical protein NTY50_01025 [Methylobacter sp.]|nr:hypothetical protein [Methylobacter sp.]
MSTNKLSSIKQLIAEKTVCVLLVRGEDTEGNGKFAYMAVRADKLPEFIEAQNSGSFYPEDYGIVIATGEGEPSAEIRQKMHDEYGFNHEAMVDLPDSEKAIELVSNISKLATQSR